MKQPNLISKVQSSLNKLLITALATTSFASMAAEQKQVAYLSISSANTWLTVSSAEIKKVAKANDIKVVEFDGQFDPAKQTAQMQDVIASGKYDGIILVSMSGAGALPDIRSALEEGIEVVVLNQVVGNDLTTADPQEKGIAASVLAPPYQSGLRQGELVIRACENINPCEVVFIYGLKGTPLDDALRSGVDKAIADHPHIKIVAEGEGKYMGPDGGIKVTQDILQINDHFDVMLGPDQAIQGAAIVLSDEDMIDKVKLIGLGGSEPAIKGIKNGTWFGGVYGAPAVEGRVAMEAMVEVLSEGNHRGGVDPMSQVPDGGLVTKENVHKFDAQWKG